MRVISLTLGLLFLGACAPGLRPYSNTFMAVNPTVVVPLQSSYAPKESGPSIVDRAKKIQLGAWGQEQIDAKFARAIVNFYTGAIGYNEATSLYELGAAITLEGEPQEVIPVAFQFNEQVLRGVGSAEGKSRDGKYAVAMKCVSEDCSEMVFRIQRAQDGAVAVLKYVRAEVTMVPLGGGAEEIPVVQHYMEVKNGLTRRQITDRNGSSKYLEPYLKTPEKLRNFRFGKAINVQPLDEKIAPGITRLTPAQKLVWIAQQFVREKVHIPGYACNKFVLYVLAAAGYTITNEYPADEFLSLIKVNPEFRNWRYESFVYQGQGVNELVRRLQSLPEGKGVILQYPKINKAYGHVAIYYREGSDFYVLDASLNDHPPRRTKRSPHHLMDRSRRRLNVIFPPE